MADGYPEEGATVSGFLQMPELATTLTGQMRGD